MNEFMKEQFLQMVSARFECIHAENIENFSFKGESVFVCDGMSYLCDSTIPGGIKVMKFGPNKNVFIVLKNVSTAIVW